MQEVVIGRIYHDVEPFRNLVPPYETPVTPVVEFVQKGMFGENISNSQNFRLKIQHHVPNIVKHDAIRVRYGNLHQASKLLKTASNEGKDKVSFKVVGDCITVHTLHLTGFIPTIPTYSQGWKLKVYGSRRKNIDGRWRVGLKVFLYNPMFTIKV